MPSKAVPSWSGVANRVGHARLMKSVLITTQIFIFLNKVIMKLMLPCSGSKCVSEGLEEAGCNDILVLSFASKEHAAQWLSNLIECANELTTSPIATVVSCFLEVLVAPPNQQNHVHTR